MWDCANKKTFRFSVFLFNFGNIYKYKGRQKYCFEILKIQANPFSDRFSYLELRNFETQCGRWKFQNANPVTTFN